jgi:hypothetical protein
MNWVKGMLRAWFAFSLIWVCAFCVASAYVWNVDAPTRAAAAEWTRLVTECGTSQAPKSGPWCDLIPSAEREYPIPLLVYPTVVLGPPALLFIVGWLGMWVARGLRASSPKAPG